MHHNFSSWNRDRSLTVLSCCSGRNKNKRSKIVLAYNYHYIRRNACINFVFNPEFFHLFQRYLKFNVYAAHQALDTVFTNISISLLRGLEF